MSSNADAKDILVSIIIVSKNGDKHLHSLLAALYRQEAIARTEVTVIDSGSSDDTLKIVAEFPEVQLREIPAKEFGHGRTRNLGARSARGEFLVFLPQDATPVGRDWLGRLLQPFDNPAVVGVFGRQIARSDASAMETFFLSRTYHERPEIKTLSAGEPESLARCFFSTVSGALRAATWARHPFREDVIMSEDQAWASEVMRAGHAIAYQPSAAVLHSHQYGIRDVFRRNFDSGYSTQQIFAGITGIGAGSALRWLADEARFVAKTGSLETFLRFFPYEISRHLGFWLGLHADRLPIPLRRACSNLGYFWDPPEEKPEGQG